MKLLITGGTGFIGRSVCKQLIDNGHHVVVLTRQSSYRSDRPELSYLSWDASSWQHAIASCDAIINLAGEPIAAKRWSPRQKLLIRESRIQAVRRIHRTLAVLSHRPSVVINASAVGYYGSRDDQELSEQSEAGTGFLAKTCQDWEQETQRLEQLNIRVVRLRIGLVLGSGGGALSKMIPPFRLYLGGPLGSGKQWVSWIHRDDVVGLIDWALANDSVRGSINATAPNPVTMKEFCRQLGATIHRPSWFPVPGFILRVLLGEMSELLLSGQRVIPKAALAGGYSFRYPELLLALQACFVEQS